MIPYDPKAIDNKYKLRVFFLIIHRNSEKKLAVVLGFGVNVSCEQFNLRTYSIRELK